MSRSTNRRGMLRDLMGEATRIAQEVTPLLRTEGASGAGKDASQDSRPPKWSTAPAPSVPAAPTQRTASIDELDDLAAAHGLEEHQAALRALARPSVRMIPTDGAAAVGSGRSSFGDGAERLLQLDLSEISVEAVPSARERDLLVFSAGETLPTVMSRRDVGVATVAVADAEEAAGDTEDGGRATRGIELSTELTLPRPWAAPVRELNLTLSESEAWEELRHELAESQGVTPLEASPDPVAIHRFLGYPDERTGSMPLVCAMLARGIEPGVEALSAPSQELEQEARSWRLLLQLSRDDELGWWWGHARKRLYVWINETDLAEGRLDRTQAVAQ